MVGNDVVDLCDPETSVGALHPRFDGRVFAPAEREALLGSEAPHRLRWTLWAAKEAAFKLVRRLDPAARFSPASFEVRLDERAVHHAGRWIPVRVSEQDDRVHAVASYTPSAARGFVEPLAALPGADPGCAARALALRAAVTLLAAPADRLSVGSDGRLPLLLLDEAPAPFVLSLSHHGRFVACALSPAALGASA